MTAFSSHRGLQDSKMRFLIVSAILACATAAPSHIVPVAFPAVRLAYPAPVPIPAGDIQAAAIDAQVKLADLAQEAADKARAINDQVVDNLNIQAYSNVDTANEKIADGAWSNEDKKWQTLGAIQTAEAQLDGAIASIAPVLAKSAVAGPYVAAVAPFPGIPQPVYPGYVAPVVKTAMSEPAAPVEAEAPKVEGEKAEAVTVEASAKTAEPEKVEQPAEAAAKAIESAADKFVAAYKSAYVGPTIGLSNAVVAPAIYPSVHYVQPVLKYVSPVQPIVPVVGPTFVKSVW